MKPLNIFKKTVLIESHQLLSGVTVHAEVYIDWHEFIDPDGSGKVKVKAMFKMERLTDADTGNKIELESISTPDANSIMQAALNAVQSDKEEQIAQERK